MLVVGGSKLNVVVVVVPIVVDVLDVVVTGTVVVVDEDGTVEVVVVLLVVVEVVLVDVVDVVLVDVTKDEVVVVVGHGPSMSCSWPAFGEPGSRKCPACPYAAGYANVNSTYWSVPSCPAA